MVLFPGARFRDPLPPLASGWRDRTLRAARFRSASVGLLASEVASMESEGMGSNGLCNGNKPLGMVN